MKKKTTEQFIIDAYCKHGDKYNYKLVDYKNNHTKVKIICPIHGIFEQTPYNHYNNKRNCKKCTGNNKKTTEEFIEKAKKVHGNKYDYSLTDYKNAKTKVKIICDNHKKPYIFEQTPNNHCNNKQGCPKCYGTPKKTTERFIEKAKKVHDNKYNYSLVKEEGYKNNHTKVKIICPVHGIFEQIPISHLKGHGCNKCANKTKSNNLKRTTEEFIQDAYCKHGDKYNYKLVDYKGCFDKVKIICPVHGIFEQSPDGHINQNQGCPKCISIISKQETELQEWLKEYIDIKTNNRSIIKPYELDIIIPKKKLCIEYNGLYWHSEQRGKDKKYHLNKCNLCKEKGYRLIQIWENEWLFKQDIVKSILLNAIGINKRIIHGRKCIIQDVSSKEARVMYDNNHIQGFKGGKHKGLYYNDELVSLMTIDKRNELQRFVNKKYTKVHGAFSKLLKAFLKEGYKDIYTFADLRYFTGNVYEKNGFKFDKTIPPRYCYFKQMNIYHRMHFQKKNIEKKYNQSELKYYNSNKTEYQNMLANGYDRIWDSGKIKWIYTTH